MTNTPLAHPAPPSAGAPLPGTPAMVASESVRRLARQQGSSRLRPAWDPMRLALGLLIILVISRVHQHFTFIGRLRPALLLAVGALAFAWANPRYLNARTVLRNPIPRMVIGMLIIACLSVPFGISIGNSGRMILFVYGKLIIIVLLTMLAIRNAGELMAMIASYVLGVGILGIFAVFVFQLEQATNLARLNDLYMWDANDAGLIFVTGIPLAAVLATNGRGAWRWIGLAVVPLSLVALVRTGSRGGFLGALAVGLALLLFDRGTSIATKTITVILAVGAFFALTPADYRSQMEGLRHVQDDYNWTSPQARKALAKRGLGTYMLHSPLGVGIDNFGKAECSDMSWFYRARSQIGGVKCSAPHSSWVQAGAETGIPGLALLAAMVIGSLVSAARLGRRVPRAWRHGTAEQRLLFRAPAFIAAALVGFAVAGSFVSFAWHEFPYLLAAFAVGLGVVWRQVAHTVPASVPRRTGGVPPVPAAAP